MALRSVVFPAPLGPSSATHEPQRNEALFDQILLLNGELVVCGPTAEAFTSQNLDRAYGMHIFSGHAHHHHDHA